MDNLPKSLTTVTTFSKLIALFLFILLPFAGFFVGIRYQEKLGGLSFEKTNTACTMEAKICPDGSSVGRTAPKCEFAACPTPTPNPTANWKTYTNSGFSFSFKYPDGLYLKSFPRKTDQIFLTSKDIDLNQVTEGPFAQIEINIRNKENLEDAVSKSKQKYQNEKNIVVSGINARKLEGIVPNNYLLSGAYESEIFVPISTGLVDIYFFNFEKTSPISTRTFDQILSTFKFTQ